MWNLFVVCLFILSTRVSSDMSTCARMNDYGMGKIAQGLCITSCSVQNCGTGHCENREIGKRSVREKRQTRPTCVCSRCGLGSSTKLTDFIGAFL
ncbi:unnamed protein product [Caenorhabditis angaria]|uniref:Uncharacterized protein n=1 Tax=Caenorhabditis angaria TaxID=860376 RepID=A0A9P1IU61_9PELO|nr:unnamed protein product [Caenorhabditis angaria]